MSTKPLSCLCRSLSLAGRCRQPLLCFCQGTCQAACFTGTGSCSGHRELHPNSKHGRNAIIGQSPFKSICRRVLRVAWIRQPHGFRLYGPIGPVGSAMLLRNAVTPVSLGDLRQAHCRHMCAQQAFSHHVRAHSVRGTAVARILARQRRFACVMWLRLGLGPGCLTKPWIFSPLGARPSQGCENCLPDVDVIKA